jgi:cytochrome P450
LRVGPAVLEHAPTAAAPDRTIARPRARRPPTPPGTLILGHASGLERDPLGFIMECQRTCGDVALFRFLAWPATLLAHPDHVKHVLQDRHMSYDKDSFDWKLLRPLIGDGLLTSQGTLWLRQRRLMQPAFHRERVAGFCTLMVDQTQAMLARWERSAERGEVLDVVAEMTRLTADIVTRALFGVAIDARTEEVAAAVAFLNRTVFERGYTPAGIWSVITGRPTRRARAALATLDSVVNQIIAARRRSSGEHDDLLAMLLAARDEESGEGMSDRQLRDEVLTLYAAGHETTANALAWTWYLLSAHPGVVDRLRAELSEVLAGRAPTGADLPKLVYTRMVVDESLRLYPPAWATLRNAMENDEIGGFAIPKGKPVVLSPYLTHRHPQFWDDPERFDPERFRPERAAARPRFAYFPFGGGPHLCIGNTFATTEATLAVATVAQRYELRLVPGTKVEPEPGVTLRVRGGLPMTISRV